MTDLILNPRFAEVSLCVNPVLRRGRTTQEAMHHLQESLCDKQIDTQDCLGQSLSSGAEKKPSASDPAGVATELFMENKANTWRQALDKLSTRKKVLDREADIHASAIRSELTTFIDMMGVSVNHPTVANSIRQIDALFAELGFEQTFTS
jgi:hypothetical protein